MAGASAPAAFLWGPLLLGLDRLWCFAPLLDSTRFNACLVRSPVGVGQKPYPVKQILAHLLKL
jgi:hypothetical protein